MSQTHPEFEVLSHQPLLFWLTVVNVTEEHCRLLEDKIMAVFKLLATRTLQQLSQRLIRSMYFADLNLDILKSMATRTFQQLSQKLM